MDAGRIDAGKSDRTLAGGRWKHRSRKCVAPDGDGCVSRLRWHAVWCGKKPRTPLELRRTSMGLILGAVVVGSMMEARMGSIMGAVVVGLIVFGRVHQRYGFCDGMHWRDGFVNGGVGNGRFC
jgi:hypothetical protein